VATLPPRKEPLVPIGKEAGWAPTAVLDAVVKRKIPNPFQDLNPIIQPIAQHYTTELSWLMTIIYHWFNF
jgi:hypothetical protein